MVGGGGFRTRPEKRGDVFRSQGRLSFQDGGGRLSDSRLVIVSQHNSTGRADSPFDPSQGRDGEPTLGQNLFWQKEIQSKGVKEKKKKKL